MADKASDQGLAASRFWCSPVVAVSVGKGREAEKYYLHSALLTPHSAFFEACLKGSWKETREETIKLEEDRPEAFTIIAKWLYGESEVLKSVSSRFAPVVDVYGLANKLTMIRLKNDIMDALRASQLAQGYADFAEDVLLVVKTGLENTPLYAYLIQLFVFALHQPFWPKTYLSTKKICENAKVMEDVLKVSRQYVERNYKDPRRGGGCMWHDHSDGIPCKTLKGTKRKSGEI